MTDGVGVYIGTGYGAVVVPLGLVVRTRNCIPALPPKRDWGFQRPPRLRRRQGHGHKGQRQRSGQGAKQRQGQRWHRGRQGQGRGAMGRYERHKACGYNGDNGDTRDARADCVVVASASVTFSGPDVTLGTFIPASGPAVSPQSPPCMHVFDTCLPPVCALYALQSTPMVR